MEDLHTKGAFFIVWIPKGKKAQLAVMSDG